VSIAAEKKRDKCVVCCLYMLSDSNTVDRCRHWH